MNSISNSITLLVLVLAGVFLMQPVAYAATKTAIAPSCSITVSKGAIAGEKGKISWKTKNTQKAVFTYDPAGRQLGIAGDVKRKGSKKVTFPASSASAVYQLTLQAYSKTGESESCSKAIEVKGTNPQSASISTASVKGGSGPITVTGSAPIGSKVEVYVAYAGQNINTDYDNVWANAKFQVTPKVFMGTLVSFANGTWSVRFDKGFPKGSRIFVFDARTKELLSTLVAS
ncbi:MAG: hypothetical protein V4682_03930 [Patescibacteria group bacterium]